DGIRDFHVTGVQTCALPISIKMNVMMSPVLGKELFELMSLVVSAVNGCETCVASHEDSLRKLGTSEVRIFDAVRLASIVKGLTEIGRASCRERGEIGVVGRT